jgi:hypothetical protein
MEVTDRLRERDINIAARCQTMVTAQQPVGKMPQL